MGRLPRDSGPSVDSARRLRYPVWLKASPHRAVPSAPGIFIVGSVQLIGIPIRLSLIRAGHVPRAMV